MLSSPLPNEDTDERIYKLEQENHRQGQGTIVELEQNNDQVNR